MHDINPLVWYSNLEIDTIPPHFVKSSTSVTEDNYFWVKTKITGRYTISAVPINDVDMIFDLRPYVFFENPSDAMLYELRWSGSK